MGVSKMDIVLMTKLSTAMLCSARVGQSLKHSDPTKDWELTRNNKNNESGDLAQREPGPTSPAHT